MEYTIIYLLCKEVFVPSWMNYNSAMYHIKNARYKLKKLNGHMPEGCTLAKVVKIAYTASVTTAEVLNGCNLLLGTTGAAGAAPITLF